MRLATGHARMLKQISNTVLQTVHTEAYVTLAHWNTIIPSEPRTYGHDPKP